MFNILQTNKTTSSTTFFPLLSLFFLIFSQVNATTSLSSFEEIIHIACPTASHNMDTEDLNTLVSTAEVLFTTGEGRIPSTCLSQIETGEWHTKEVDCRNGNWENEGTELEQTIQNILAAQTDSLIAFRYYFRALKAQDSCSETELQKIQLIIIKFISPAAGLGRIEMPFGTNIDPVHLYEAWKQDPIRYAAYATWIPNYDPTSTLVHIEGLSFPSRVTNNSGDEVPLDPSGECGLNISWEDSQHIPTYAGGYKLFREWTAFNWCEGHLEILGSIPQIITVNGSLNIIEHSDSVCANEDCFGTIETQFEVFDATATYRFRPYGGAVITDYFGQLKSLGQGKYRISGDYPVGEHKFILDIDTGTEIEEFTLEFEVRDCESPTVYCRFGLEVDLPPSGEIELQISDFDAGSTDDCSEVSLTFANPTLYPDSTARKFNCRNGELGAVAVEIWGEDRAGNLSFCASFLTINKPELVNCDDRGNMQTLRGTVKNSSNRGILNANIELRSQGENIENVSTTATGGYDFYDIPLGQSYSITPSKTDNIRNGISTYDIVLIHRHITREVIITDPYLLLAADINRSGTISSLDMLELRAVSLGLRDQFENNTSWRFIPANYQFPTTSNSIPTAIPEFISIENLSEPLSALNFIGVKVGDVNNNANIQTDVEEREFASSFQLRAADQTLKAGEISTMTLTANLASIDGLQFTLSHLGLEVIDIISRGATPDNFGLFDDYLNVSWVGDTQATELVQFVFRAKKDLKLSEVLYINSTKLQAEAYAKNGNFQNVDLVFDESLNYQLYQNYPNPSQEHTSIGFSLPNSQTATLTIRDVNGSVITQIKGEFKKGYNEVVLNTEAFPAGVLSYTLSNKQFTNTKLMLVID